MKVRLAITLAAAVLTNGCVSYVYHIVQPPGVPQPLAKEPVAIRYEPLEYRLSQSNDRLQMQISNLTDDRLVLLADRSYVVAPDGQTHPIRGFLLGPHSYTQMSLPPVPMTIAYPDYWGWGWGYGWGGPYWGWRGWYGPYWGPYYGVYYGPPPVSYVRVNTHFDWTWKTGLARLRLSYGRNTNIFEHDFELVREEAK